MLFKWGLMQLRIVRIHCGTEDDSQLLLLLPLLPNAGTAEAGLPFLVYKVLDIYLRASGTLDEHLTNYLLSQAHRGFFR